MNEQEQMTESYLVSLIRTQLDTSREYGQTHYGYSRELARDYYYSRGLALGKTCAGESNIISADVPDAIDATLAAMLPAFNATDLLAEFEANGPDDEDSAEEESKVVSHILVDGNVGVIRQALFDSLLLRNTALKVSWESVPETSIDSYENLTVEQMAMAAPQMMGEEGELEPTAVDQNEDGTYNVTLRKKTPRGIPTIQCLPIDEVSVNASHQSCDVTDAKFTAHSPSNVTASDLIEMGFDAEVIDQIPDYNDYGNRIARVIDDNNADRSVRNVDVHEVYMLVDYDGDGVAERRRIIMGGDYILLNEEVAYGQIVTGSCWPIPHQWDGVSLFDRIKEIQDGKTDLIRQSINVNNFNLLQMAVVNPARVELDDLQTGSRRRIIRAKDPHADIAPYPAIALDNGTQALLMQLDKMRSERAGGALDMNLEGLPVGTNTTAHGVERVMTAMESMVAAYIDNFSQTVIRPLYLHIHRLLREHGAEMQLNLGGQYITTDPSKWQPRTKINVVTGAGLGEQSRKSQAMINVLMAQKELMMAGSGLVTEENLYQSLMDSAKYSGIDYPEQFFVDPSSPEAQQAAQAKQQAAQAEAQKQEQQMMMQAQFQQSLVQMTEDTKRMKAQMDMLNDKLDRDLETEKELNAFSLKATELELVHNEDVPGSAV